MGDCGMTTSELIGCGATNGGAIPDLERTLTPMIEKMIPGFELGEEVRRR